MSRAQVVTDCRLKSLPGCLVTVTRRDKNHQVIQIEPACLQSLHHDWLRASVDGITADGHRVVEIKCGESAYRKTANTGSPPSYYVGQLQHILAVTGLPVLDFLCFLPPRPPLLIEVARDDQYIRTLLEKEQKFWSGITG